MRTCTIHSLRGNAAGWGSSTTRFEHKHFHQLFATHTQGPPLLHVHPRSPWDEALQSLGQREEPRPAPHPLAIPTLGLRCHLQHTPAKCGLMGQAWHGKVSGGVIRVRWQAASSVGAILHSLFSTSLKGNPLFALSLYSQWEAAGAFLPLSRPLMNSWLEILI